VAWSQTNGLEGLKFSRTGDREKWRRQQSSLARISRAIWAFSSEEQMQGKSPFRPQDFNDR
jgi:hypothetical protein